MLNNFRRLKRYSWKDYVGPYEIRLVKTQTGEIVFSKPINIFRGEFLFEYTGLIDTADYMVPYATEKYLNDLKLGTVTLNKDTEYNLEVLFNTTDLINFWKAFPIYNPYGEFYFGNEWSGAINYFKQENLGLSTWGYYDENGYYIDGEKIQTPFMKDLPKDKILKLVILNSLSFTDDQEDVFAYFNPQPIASLYDGLDFFYIEREIHFTVNIM